jgi:hypothetical protein
MTTLFSLACFVFCAGLINAQAASISGTVTNSTGSSGWVYLSLVDSTGGQTSLGTAAQIAAGGSVSYTIRGVEVAGNNSYKVNAFLDVYSRSLRLANSPYGETSSFSFSGSSLTGKDITLSAPSVAITSQVPAPNVVTLSDAAMISFGNSSISSVIKSNGLYIPESMKIYWGYASGSLTNSLTVPLNDRGLFAILKGLTTGATLYGKLVPVVNGSEISAYASAVFSAALSAPSGGSTLTGKVNSTGITKNSTPLYLFAESDSGGNIAYAGSAADSQSYTIYGLTAGTYKLHAFLDMDNNGYMNTGDIYNQDNQAQTVTVDGSTSFTAPDIILTAGNAEVTSGTSHWRSSGAGTYDSYMMKFSVQSKEKQPVGATITAGSNLSVTPIDLGWISDWGEIQGWPQLTARPNVGDTYTLRVNYSDSSSEDLTLSVSSVLDKFATLVYPAGSVVFDSSSQKLSWRLPDINEPSGYYFYQIYVQDSSNSTVWSRNDSISLFHGNSINYNDDGNASLSSFTSGSTYSWTILLNDSFGNQSQYQGSFTPQSSGPTITGFSPAGGAAGTSVTITGTGFDSATPSNNVVTFHGQTATVNSATATTITTTVPSGATRGPLTVTVGSVTAESSDNFAATVVYSGTALNKSSAAVSTATVTTVGLAETLSEVSGSAGTGTFSLTVPAGRRFYLRFHDTGGAYMDTYSHITNFSTDNSGGSFTLFKSSELPSAAQPTTGRGVIAGRVKNADTDTNLTGATVTANSRNHGSGYYTVAYTSGSSTASDGRYYVLNVDEGDYVSVTATLSGYGFNPKTFITHGDAMSQGGIKGTTLPVVTPSVAGGTYCAAQTVTLTGDSTACASGCTIYYTTDGTDPLISTSVQTYSGSISVSSSETLKYYAVNGNGISGDAGSATYTIASSVTGSCGSANGSFFDTAPDSGLCNAGSAGSVSGSGPWTWTCSGLCGGGDASCGAGINTYQLTATAVGAGSGTISSSSGGISYSYPDSHTGSASYNAGTSVTLTATATSGSVAWSGCDSTGGDTSSATCTVSVGAAKTVTADYSLASCANEPVQNYSTTTSYWSIQTAYDAAAGGNEIYMQSGDFGETLTLANTNAVKLLGGYNCGYSSAGGFTTVHGSVTLKGGTVTFSGIKIK